VSEPGGTLPAFLSSLAERFAAHEALISRRGRYDFATLAARAGDLAAGLAAMGVERGTHVGLLMPNWPEWIALAFAVWRRGAVLVPISTLYRPRELEHALSHADVEVLVSVRRFLAHDYVGHLESIGSTALPRLRRVVWLDPPAGDEAVDLGALRGTPAASVPVASDDVATIFFTSGSTADPKGVVHDHASLVRAAEADAEVLGLDAEDRTWGYLPFFFAGGLVAVALTTLSRGAAVVLQETFDAGETLELLERERVTVFFAWPHQAEALITHPRFDRARLRLRKGVGANTKWASTIYAPDHQAVGTFGMTETPPFCAAWRYDAPLARRAANNGPPVGERELRIVDPESGRPLRAGSEGELCVRGPELLRGYYKEPPGACFDAEGFFHTGDLARLEPDGSLVFIGRLKDVIKTAGVNVAAAEVEAVLLEHPAVRAAHAVGVPDAARGENVGAFVVLGGDADVEQLLVHCRARLASYKVPRHLWVRAEDALPTKSSGKVDKRALRDEAVRLTAASDVPSPPPGARS
jgi:acyl-CoA synthetase (AMP-forming)/AMP-acid ligase II